MLLIFILFFLLTVVLSALTTIPFSIAILVVWTVIFRKSWVFFAAFGIGLFLDLYSLRSLGYTSLIFTVLIFIIGIYERKFETQTMTFVFFAAFLASLSYLLLFGYNQVLMQALISALFAIVFFRFCHPELVSGSH